MKCFSILLHVIAVSLLTLTLSESASFTQAADDVTPTCIGDDGVFLVGTQAVPYWAKNNSLNAPAAETGEMFMFRTFPPRDAKGDALPCRVAIYAYAKGENDTKYKPIPVRSDIDVEKRYTSKRSGGLMASCQLDENGNSASLFLPHSVYDLKPGLYQIAYSVTTFTEEAGKTVTEEYELSSGLYVEVIQEKSDATSGRRNMRNAKSKTSLIPQEMFETSEDLASIFAVKYSLEKATGFKKFDSE
ncbi:MAG: hypothetical protein ACRC2T_05255 [Thermoguttaceae bacterium]